MAPRTYQLIILVRQDMEINIGRLGQWAFRAGRYVYTGSAKRNLEARLSRHLAREDKKVHWHIDYLLAATEVEILETRRFQTAECELNQATPGIIPVPGFGASDCRHGCVSHLKYQATL